MAVNAKPTITLEEFEQAIANRRGVTVEQMHTVEWLHGVPCGCTDYELCKGWRLAYIDMPDGKET